MGLSPNWYPNAASNTEVKGKAPTNACSDEFSSDPANNWDVESAKRAIPNPVMAAEVTNKIFLRNLSNRYAPRSWAATRAIPKIMVPKYCNNRQKQCVSNGLLQWNNTDTENTYQRHELYSKISAYVTKGLCFYIYSIMDVK